MDGKEQFSRPHISENVAALLIGKLEPGMYSLKERDVEVKIQIIDMLDLGQHIVVHTVSSDEIEKVTTDIKVIPAPDNGLPDISAVSTRSRKDNKDTSTFSWHTDMTEDSREGRARFNNTMPESFLVRIIEYVRSPNKQLIPEDL